MMFEYGDSVATKNGAFTGIVLKTYIDKDDGIVYKTYIRELDRIINYAQSELIPLHQMTFDFNIREFKTCLDVLQTEINNLKQCVLVNKSSKDNDWK